ncbi:MAG: hypothetical protein JNM02_08765 [Anaerolineales bacterium]|nr:hypothetical protein [Anaerolineales bacterium]
MKKTNLLLFILTASLLAACAPQASPAPTPIPTQEQTPLSPPTAASIPTTESNVQQTPSSVWKEIRDPRFGFGLAVPCWWIISPIPSEGTGGVLGLANYDEAYFMANSNKGYWDWPNGTLKIDIVVFENIDPSLSDVDAYMAMVDTSMEELVSAEIQQTGAHTASVLTLRNLVNQNDPPIRVFLYRLAPEKLILINPIPQSIIDTPDFQSILASIALTPQEAVSISLSPPVATPLIEASCMQ